MITLADAARCFLIAFALTAVAMLAMCQLVDYVDAQDFWWRPM